MSIWRDRHSLEAGSDARRKMEVGRAEVWRDRHRFQPCANAGARAFDEASARRADRSSEEWSN